MAPIPGPGARASAVGAASQWCSNERMMVYFKLMMVKRLLMMVKCKSMMVKCVYDHKVNSPSLTSISPSLTSISPSLMSILPSLAWSKTSFAHLTIIEKLHRLLGGPTLSYVCACSQNIKHTFDTDSSSEVLFQACRKVFKIS